METPEGSESHFNGNNTPQGFIHVRRARAQDQVKGVVNRQFILAIAAKPLSV